MVTWHLFILSLRVHLAHSGALWEAVQMIAAQDPINPCNRHFDLMVAGKIPNDPLRTEMIGFAQIQDLVLNLLGCFIGMIVRS